MTAVLAGTIPPGDIPKLKAEGIEEIFGPGTALAKIIRFVSAKAP